MKVLFIAPHPDDETIGAGGAIARHTALGDTIFWCVITEAYSPEWPDETLRQVRKQIDSVEKAYGFEKVFRLGFPTVKLNTVPHIQLCRAIENVIKAVRPDVVYTTSRNDINLDHRIVYDSTLVATRPLPGNSVRRVLSYEIGYTRGYGIPSGASVFQPSVFVDITAYLDFKLSVLKLYNTELREAPHPRNIESIKLLARERGICAGCEAAESFELIRELL